MAMDAHPAPEHSPPTSLLRVFFIPFFATGHILPMADLARQLAARGVDCTLVLTPANVPLVRRAVACAARTGSPIRLLTCPFPAVEAGLPEGVENLATAAPSEEGKIYAAVALSEPARRRILLMHRPDALVVDWWTTGLDRGLGIPWVTFRPIGAFPVCALRSLNKHRPHDGVADWENRPFVVPGLPDTIELVRSELPEILREAADAFHDRLERVQQVEREAYGSVVNSFYELEPAYADLCRREDSGREWWFVGPLALGCDDAEKDEVAAEAEHRGFDEESPAVNNAEQCMAWLNTQPPASVVFVCFGSWCQLSGEQLRELAAGLEVSGCTFLWAMKEGLTQWLPEDFEARVAGQGLVVRGWVPQVAVLRHPAVGAFVTHCGWNSLMEGVSAGVPMVTWPLQFEQFVNARLVVQVLRVGVRLHRGVRSSLSKEEGEEVVVKMAEVAEVVGRFAVGKRDEEVEEMRRRAKQYAGMATAAVRKGGSSCNDVDCLIERLQSYARGKK